MAEFDFDPPKSRAYYNRPRRSTRSPWFWVVMPVGFVCMACLASFIWSGLHYAVSTKPREPLENHMRRHLAKLGFDESEVVALRIRWHSSNAAASVAVADSPSEITCTWGQWSFYGQPDTIRRIRAAARSGDPPP